MSAPRDYKAIYADRKARGEFDRAHESGDPLVEELSFLVKSWNVADLVAKAREEAS